MTERKDLLEFTKLIKWEMFAEFDARQLDLTFLNFMKRAETFSSGWLKE
jgi:hypothetical protein